MTNSTHNAQPHSSSNGSHWFHFVGLVAMVVLIAAVLSVPLFSSLFSSLGAGSSAEIEELLTAIQSIRDYVLLPAFLVLGLAAIAGGFLAKRRSGFSNVSFWELWTAAPIVVCSIGYLLYLLV